MLKGACRGGDVGVFFPKRGQTTAKAVKTCRGCPVLDDCKSYADLHGIDYGVWGGEHRNAR